MANIQADKETVAPTATDVGDAVGMEKREWFVAIVNYNTEKSVKQKLDNLKYEAYVATQPTLRIWKNGRKAKIERVVIPNMVFIKCSKSERKQIVTLPFINRFLTNRAGNTSANSKTKPLAIIPQKEIETLQYMLCQPDIPITFIEAPTLKLKDKVVVVRGKLKGIEGSVIETYEDKSEVVVSIDILGTAKMTINTTDLELIQ